MKNYQSLIIGLITGTVLTYIVAKQFIPETTKPDSKNQDNAADASAPLYWVAPMDKNYRRDKPGLSPMGMELIPVYPQNNNTSAGTVSISPSVVNNLGVRTAKVKLARLALNIDAAGYLQYNQDKLVFINPRVEGWVEQLHVKYQGQAVTKGQALYTLYSPVLVNAQQDYLLALKRKNNDLIKAAKQKLLTLQVSESTIQSLETAKKPLNKITFYAPQSGVIEQLNIKQGAFIQPGNPLMTIADLTEIWVEVEVHENQASFLKNELAANMTLAAFPGQQWQGTVDYIYPSLNPVNRTIRARLRFDNSEQQLKANMFGQVQIKTKQSQPSLLVPRQAVIRTGKQNRVVLVLTEDQQQPQFKSVAVTLGQVTHKQAQILSGLTAEDQVVVSGQFLLDSESSIDSDFKRMSKMDDMSEMDNMSDMQHMPNMPNMSIESKTDMPPATIQSASVMGVINSITADIRSINISREAIEKWGRPAATMDFHLDDSLALAPLSQGQSIHFTFEIQQGEFVIVAYQISGQEEQ
ncbi:efflux RND transporter periplasmic adaptor subunit [Paraglaciecola sp. L3A3]|uniref:efflux RND transporter periplasmic adaptor subunit n=1 Tax=Paraglaciecola sp. L3A3 TaxID=2686358 RepID=UPI00131D5986|nr:efflux RND transporter periplasmic adaptor subunit [Paraglaciecola sp. L3A3]